VTKHWVGGPGNKQTELCNLDDQAGDSEIQSAYTPSSEILTYMPISNNGSVMESPFSTAWDQVHETIQVQDKASVELMCSIFSTHRRFCLFRNFNGYMLFLFRRNNDGIIMHSCQCDFELYKIAPGICYPSFIIRKINKTHEA